jgi:uncharacterized RDD family membrane protein YckC
MAKPAILNFVQTTTGSTITLTSSAHHQLSWPADESIELYVRYLRGNIYCASPPSLSGTAAPLGVYLRVTNGGLAQEHFFMQQHSQRGAFVPFLNVVVLASNAFANCVSSSFAQGPGLFIGHLPQTVAPRDWKLEVFDQDGAPLDFTQLAVRIEIVPRRGAFRRNADG